MMTTYERDRQGKLVHPLRYLRRVSDLNNSTDGGAFPCRHHHFGCAAWEGGPCSAELAAEHDPEGTI